MPENKKLGFWDWVTKKYGWQEAARLNIGFGPNLKNPRVKELYEYWEQYVNQEEPMGQAWMFGGNEYVEGLEEYLALQYREGKISASQYEEQANAANAVLDYIMGGQALPAGLEGTLGKDVYKKLVDDPSSFKFESLPYYSEAYRAYFPLRARQEGEAKAQRDQTVGDFFNQQRMAEAAIADPAGRPQYGWSSQQFQTGQTESTMASRNMYDVARVAARDDWRSQYQEVLSSPEMRAPENWIQSWFIKNTPEPDFGIGKPWYGMTPGERGYEYGQGDWGVNTGEMLRAGYTSMDAFKGAKQAEAERLGIPYSAARITGTGPMPLGEPTAPKHYAPEPVQPPATPDWLALLFPQLKAGQPVKPLKSVRTPSAQQWGNLTPTQQAMASGYLGWSGQKYGEMPSMEDLMADMQKRLPKSPYGAGYRNWGASRQYA